MVGTSNPFELTPRGLPNIPSASTKPANSIKAKRPDAPAPVKPRPVADRSQLTSAEIALRKVDDARRAEEADIGARQKLLDAERIARQSDYVGRRKAATAAVVAARQAYRKAGGSD